MNANSKCKPQREQSGLSVALRQCTARCEQVLGGEGRSLPRGREGWRGHARDGAVKPANLGETPAKLLAVTVTMLEVIVPAAHPAPVGGEDVRAARRPGAEGAEGSGAAGPARWEDVEPYLPHISMALLRLGCAALSQHLRGVVHIRERGYSGSVPCSTRRLLSMQSNSVQARPSGGTHRSREKRTKGHKHGPAQHGPAERKHGGRGLLARVGDRGVI